MWTHLWRRLQLYRKTLGMKHSHSYPTKIVILIKSVILMKGVGVDIWFCLDKIQNFCIVWGYLIHKFEHAFNKHGTWFHPHGFTKFQRCELNLENFLRLLCVHIHFVIPLVFESLRNQKWTVRTCQKWQFCHISTIGILIWCGIGEYLRERRWCAQIFPATCLWQIWLWQVSSKRFRFRTEALGNSHLISSTDALIWLEIHLFGLHHQTSRPNKKNVIRSITLLFFSARFTSACLFQNYLKKLLKCTISYSFGILTSIMGRFLSLVIIMTIVALSNFARLPMLIRRTGSPRFVCRIIRLLLSSNFTNTSLSPSCFPTHSMAGTE